MFHLYEFRMVVIFSVMPFQGVMVQETVEDPVIVNLNLTDDLVANLYEKYLEVVDDAQNQESQRRLFTRNKQYKIHIKHLKEVNGYKRHNLLIREENKQGNPYIYINNPVESGLPNAYLTLDEFKRALTNRVQLQKDEVARMNSKVNNLRAVTPRVVSVRKIIEDKPTRTSSKLSNYSTIKIKHENTTKRTSMKTTQIIPQTIKPKTTTKRLHVKTNSTKKMIDLIPNINKRLKTKKPIKVVNKNHTAMKNAVTFRSNEKIQSTSTNNAAITVNHSKLEGEATIAKGNEILNTQKEGFTTSIKYELSNDSMNTDLIIHPFDTEGIVNTKSLDSTTNEDVKYSTLINAAENYTSDTTVSETDLSTDATTKKILDTIETEDFLTETTISETEVTVTKDNPEDMIVELTQKLQETTATDGSTTEAATETDDTVTEDSLEDMEEELTEITTTTSTKRTWKTLGRPAVYMGGDME